MDELENLPPPGPEPQLTENAVTVLKSRYLIKDGNNVCTESPAQLFNRVALHVAKAEQSYGASSGEIKGLHRRFYDLMASLRFLPNSPTLMNAGRGNSMLSACFVLPIEDSIEEIFESIKQTAIIQKAGGGTGFSFDHLRPTGDRVASSGGTTSGPISFWRVFSQTTDAIQQGAFRRGANMGMMSVEHPDILKFLRAKMEPDVFVNFNVSVKITDRWMQKVLKSGNTLHIVTNFRTGRRYLLPKKIDISSYGLSELKEIAGKKAPRVNKKDFYTVGDIWKIIIKCAHQAGEPGLAFVDRINRENPTPSLGRIEATNPCGEQPLLPYEACNLGSINLTKFITEKDGRAAVDYASLARTIHPAVRFLDNIIDVCNYPVRETVKLVRGNRKIGLGVMGLADCLFLLGIPYDSEKAIEFSEKIMSFVNEEAHQASISLADERGPFPNWYESTWRTKKKIKLRNAAVTCVAPTGTISIIADCSAGIEPLYSPVFLRRILNGSELVQINPVFRRMAEQNDFYSKKLEEKIARAGTIQKIPEIPAKIRGIFKFAYDIKPEWHIRIQAAFQKYCDAAVSKTVNFGPKASLKAVEKAFKLAYHLDCKGVTIYRRCTRECEPMSLY